MAQGQIFRYNKKKKYNIFIKTKFYVYFKSIDVKKMH